MNDQNPNARRQNGRDDFLKSIPWHVLVAQDTLKNNEQPLVSQSLAGHIRRYINAKCEWSTPTPEFVKEILSKLYSIHEYNSQLLELNRKYPRSRQLDLLLVRYVELEFEALYGNQKKPGGISEEQVGQRVLRLLHVILNKSVLHDKMLLNKNTDFLLKKAILQLLAKVRSDYLVEDKFLGRIARNLLENVGQTTYGRDVVSYLKTSMLSESERCSITSDYGSDSDFDCDNATLTSFEIHPETSDADTRDDFSWTSSPAISTKNETNLISENNENECKYFPEDIVKNANGKVDNQIRTKLDENTDFNKSTTPIENDKALQNHVSKENIESESDVVVICSDSEDEVVEVKEKRIVTFEIMDDDEEGDLNYMIYMQKDTIKQRPKRNEIVQKDVIVCSDSENEDEDLKSNNHEKIDVLPESPVADVVTKSEERDAIYDETTVNDFLKFLNTGDVEENSNESSKSKDSDDKNCIKKDVNEEHLIPDNNLNKTTASKTNDIISNPEIDSISEINFDQQMDLNSDLILNSELDSCWDYPFAMDQLKLGCIDPGLILSQNFNTNADITKCGADQPSEGSELNEKAQTIGGPLLCENHIDQRRSDLCSFEDLLFSDSFPDGRELPDFDSFNFNGDNDVTFGEVSRVTIADNDGTDGLEHLNHFIEAELQINFGASSNKRKSENSSFKKLKRLRREENSKKHQATEPVRLSLDRRKRR